MGHCRGYVRPILLFLIALLPASASFAQGAAQSSPRVVLQGYDPVAYFTEGRPVKGSAANKYDWDDARYLFASASNRDKFAANPERYAPQFDGYCTGSMSKNIRAEADPQAWVIADGRLYVFGQIKFAEMARNDARWLTDTAARAGEHWRAKK